MKYNIDCFDVFSLNVNKNMKIILRYRFVLKKRLRFLIICVIRNEILQIQQENQGPHLCYFIARKGQYENEQCFWSVNIQNSSRSLLTLFGEFLLVNHVKQYKVKRIRFLCSSLRLDVGPFPGCAPVIRVNIVHQQEI